MQVYGRVKAKQEPKGHPKIRTATRSFGDAG